MICPKCKKDKEPKEFSWQTNNCGASPSLRHPECKACLSEINKQKRIEKNKMKEFYSWI